MDACAPLAAKLRDRAQRSGWLSERRLIVNAGEGTTGTSSLNEYARCCGLRTLKWPAESLHSVSRVSPRSWRDLNLSAALDGADFVSDTPVGALLPYILAVRRHHSHTAPPPPTPPPRTPTVAAKAIRA